MKISSGGTGFKRSRGVNPVEHRQTRFEVVMFGTYKLRHMDGEAVPNLCHAARL